MLSWMGLRLIPRESVWRGPLTPTLSPQAGRGSSGGALGVKFLGLAETYSLVDFALA
jgi:hypothetical protein